MNSKTKIGNEALVQAILSHMQTLIKQHGLDLMSLYPDDLLVHDKAVLERVAFPGATVAWMVGHCHTHIVPLGLHPEGNKMVEYMTNLASDDRFYVITIAHGERFAMKELSRKEFAALSSTAVPYERKGDGSNFWLYRNKQQVGYVELKLTGTPCEQKVEAKITPCAGISGHALAALHNWCSHGCTKLAGTLFVKTELTWGEPIRLAEVA